MNEINKKSIIKKLMKFFVECRNIIRISNNDWVKRIAL